MAADSTSDLKLEKVVLHPGVHRSETVQLMRRFRGNVSGMVGLGLVLLVVVMSVGAPLFTDADPTSIDPDSILLLPSAKHPFGTDALGRDMYSRVPYGARVSVLIALFVVIVTSIIGPLFGFLAGFYSRLDGPIMRVVDLVLAIPTILLALGIVAVLGPRLPTLLIALVIPFTAPVARIARAKALQLKEEEFVVAARAIGATDRRILARHILPNSMAALIVLQTFTLAVTILSEAALTFLGVGVPPQVPTLGSMIAETRGHLQAQPWLPLFPGVAIFAFVLGANLLGDGLRDVLDPRMKL